MLGSAPNRCCLQHLFFCKTNVLGIDEFRGNAAGQKYQVILTDPDSYNVIDVLPKKDTIYKDCFLGMQVV